MRLASPERTPIQIGSTTSEISPLFEVADIEPDTLREAAFRALSSLSRDKRSDFCSRLFDGLRKAGFKVRPCLLMLGASASTYDELTAPEIASLIRYVRLTEPKVMLTVAALLTELLTVLDLRDTGKAA